MNNKDDIGIKKTEVMESGEKHYPIFYYEDKATVKVEFPSAPLEVGTYYPKKHEWKCQRKWILRPDVKRKVELFYHPEPSLG